MIDKKTDTGQVRFKIARAGKHLWEEPVLSGSGGSGTIFFSGCTLRCVYCQNYEISRGEKGVSVSGDRLVRLMLWLEREGAHNINLVTPSHYIKTLPGILESAKKSGLKIPVVYNSGGYDPVSGLKNLEGLVDIYLPDFKYADSRVSLKYSGIDDYFEVASAALSEMRRQQPKDVFKNGLMKKGVIVRHLILPENTKDSQKVLDTVADLDKSLYVSLMAQYFPTGNMAGFPELNRRITQEEYDEVLGRFFKAGLCNGFTQALDSAIEDYVPDFDLDALREILANLPEN